MAKWRDAETQKPKTDADVLVWEPKNGIRIAFWSGIGKCWGGMKGPEPTHWQPLPKAPELEEEP